MKAFYRLSLFLGMLAITSLSFAGGATHYKPYNSSSSNSSAYQKQSMADQWQNFPAFNKLVISGNVDVALKNAAQNSIIFLDDTSSAYINYDVKDHSLTISQRALAKKHPFANAKPPLQRPQIQINVVQLNQLDTSGHVVVQGQLNSSSLVVNTKGSSQVNLSGMMNLQQANAYDNSQLKLYWINSPNLIVNGTNNSLIKLAGITQVLHASLKKNAQLNAQYLRAQQAIIQTDNNAFVGIAATSALRAFASNDSNIFYYKYPHDYSEFSIESGNILQVDWRP